MREVFSPKKGNISFITVMTYEIYPTIDCIATNANGIM